MSLWGFFLSFPKQKIHNFSVGLTRFFDSKSPKFIRNGVSTFMVNVKDVQVGTTTRKSFAKINEVMQMPNLIEVQKKSYQWFLDEGLKEVFRDIGSITDYTGNLVLDFIDYSMDDEPKYTIAQCKARDVSYAKPLKVRARLQNKETGEVK